MLTPEPHEDLTHRFSALEAREGTQLPMLGLKVIVENMTNALHWNPEIGLTTTQDADW